MKTTFITSFHGLISRVLQSGILDYLQEKKDLRIVILVPDFKKDYFLEKFSKRKNVVIEGISDKTLPRRAYIFHKLSFVLLDTKTMRLTRRSFRGYKHFYEFVVAQFVASFLGRWKFVRNLFRAINYYFSGKSMFDFYFDKYKPDIVFSTDIKHVLDTQLVIEAKKRKIFTIGMVRSWDYLTGKGMVRVVPDKMIVHNEVIKKEAIKYVDMKEKDIFVSGLPHFDPYINEKRSDRGDFFKKIGVDKNEKLLLYIPWGDKFADTDWQFLQMLPGDLQVLMRLPPGDTVNLEKFNQCKNVIIDSPGIVFGERGRKTNEMSYEDLLHLADSIFYSDVVVAPPSTLVIDAAAFDNPVVLMAFDGESKKKYYEGVGHYYDFDHISNLVRAGGARLAKNEKELIKCINDYLKNPSLDREGRKRVVDEQCWKLDGRSSQRVAGYILSFL